jgi:hypothetical protein
MEIAEWGIRPRRLLVALQYLQVFWETKDKEYLQKSLKEVLDVSVDEDFAEYRGMIDKVIFEFGAPGLEEDVAGLQGRMEGLHIRILLDTYPHKQMPHPYDGKDRMLKRVDSDGHTSPDITDVWIRQDGRWINATPPDRTHSKDFRITEQSSW